MRLTNAAKSSTDIDNLSITLYRIKILHEMLKVCSNVLFIVCALPKKLLFDLPACCPCYLNTYRGIANTFDVKQYNFISETTFLCNSE